MAGGDSEWVGIKDDLASQPTFTFVRRDTNQPSGPPTPSDHDHPDESDTMSEAEDRNETPTNCAALIQPRFTRAFSQPQLGRLENPHRSHIQRPFVRQKNHSDPGTSISEQFYELSLELADLVQMAIQTLLQVSTPQILEPTKEQFSACALSVPTPSISAMFTAMRNLNYFSANMAFFCEPSDDTPGSSSSVISRTDFDLGELLQSVGDVISGAAAQVGVDLVPYHGDLSFKNAWVRGSESGLTVALCHILRQIMSVAHRGDSIEIGLFIGFAPTPGQEITVSDDLVTTDALTSSPTSEDGPIHCTIQIAHKFVASATDANPRTEPRFSSLILHRLLRQIGGSLTHDPPSSTEGRTCELSLTLDRAPTSPSDTGSAEPTSEELAAFAETLKGAKVALYASSKGSFAQHVTRYLADWGMDVSHMSADGDVDGDGPSNSPHSIPSVPPFPSISETPNAQGNPTKADAGPQPLSFIFIDDNVTVLKERLDALRVEQPFPLTLNPKRPPLPHHSRRFTTQTSRVTTFPTPTSSVVILHFTSLANFKLVKDVLPSVLSSYVGTSSPVPEVMIVPKPAGPQRVLTQLHMAVTKPPVDPFFSPIATSPATPLNSFYGSTSYSSNSFLAGSNRPPSARSNSDRSSRSGAKDVFERSGMPPPSPLSMSNSADYFSDDAVQLGSTPSSGLLISSPPGQPAGIFFSPRPKTSKKTPFVPTMERDKGQLLTSSSRRTSISRNPSDTPTFSSLHEIAASPHPTSRGPKITLPTTERPVSPDPVPPPIAIKTDSSEAVPQQSSSPPASPQATTPTFRRPVRRRTATPDLKALEKGKAAPDIDIVPPINVLIVEDNVVNQMQLAGFMRKKKLKFQLAKNGLEAIEKWKHGNFDLILMDIQMPVMGGIEATKEIRRLEKLNAQEGYPPSSPSGAQSDSALSASSYNTISASPYRSSVIIVAQTASSLNSDRVKALAAGCNDFLTKPVNHHWLNNKVTEWGSIKALQMWADMPPPGGQNGSTSQARQVADRLHTAEGGKQVAVKAAAVMSAPSTAVFSSTSSAFWSPNVPSPATFWGTLGIPEPMRKPAAEAQSTTNYPDSPTSAGGKRAFLSL
ncbi:hypothetical protein GGX14DRAFT_416699 [Mycena pura]|uniref:Response regulatory domain-containing protein n=1 Tax=Mycena pura TaxID=153505 RepID=A0AAD6YUL0_9AGAR|nr:hypothetical protein GGX14DRAFT_416699 [Mycena pura]